MVLGLTLSLPYFTFTSRPPQTIPEIFIKIGLAKPELKIGKKRRFVVKG
jgi:hypothetical protein